MPLWTVTARGKPLPPRGHARRAGAQWAARWALLLVFCVTPPAAAFDATVDATLDAQFYSWAGPTGEPVLARRRYTSTLGLDLVNLRADARPDSGTLEFRSRLRFDTDFGVQWPELDPASSRFVPGLRAAPLELLHAYLEGTGFASGLLGFRVGRQYVVDALGFWSFDGALASVSTPAHFAVSGFVGFEQRPGLPILASPRFSADGVWRGDRTDLEHVEYASFLDDSALAPAAGVSLETIELPFVHARVSYRKVQSRSTVLVSPFLNERGAIETFGETRTASERAGASARLDVAELGSLSVDGVYDLYLGLVSDANATLDWYASERMSVGAELDYVYPTYDGDSIFNWFAHGPSTRAQGRWSWGLGAFDVSWRFGARWSETYGASSPLLAASRAESEETQSRADVIADADVRYRFGTAMVAMSAAAEAGHDGHHAGADLTVTKYYLGGRYDSLLVLSAYDWYDPLRPSRDAESFMYVLGAGFVPGDALFGTGRFGVTWEHAMNRLVGHRFRVLLEMELVVSR